MQKTEVKRTNLEGSPSSAPGRCPRRTSPQRLAPIEALRRERLTGPAIAHRLGMARSTVGLLLRRLGLGKLAALGPKGPVVRYERSLPGELVHLDTKKLGRFGTPGHRVTGLPGRPGLPARLRR